MELLEYDFKPKLLNFDIRLFQLHLDSYSMCFCLLEEYERNFRPSPMDCCTLQMY